MDPGLLAPKPPLTPGVAVTLLCAWQWGQGTGALGGRESDWKFLCLSHPVLLPLCNSHHDWNNFLLISLELQSHTLKPPGDGHTGRSLKWQRCVMVGGGGGGVGTASVHLQHFPAVRKCQLSIAKYWDFKRIAGNGTAWNLPLFLNIDKLLKMLNTLLVWEDVSVAEMSFSDSLFLIDLDVKFHRVQESHWLCLSFVYLLLEQWLMYLKYLLKLLKTSVVTVWSRAS